MAKKSKFKDLPITLQNFLIGLDDFLEERKIENIGDLRIELNVYRERITDINLVGGGQIFRFKPGELSRLKNDTEEQLPVSRGDVG